MNLCCILLASGASYEELKIVDQKTLLMKEVSGLSWSGKNGKTAYVRAVSDSDPFIVGFGITNKKILNDSKKISVRKLLKLKFRQAIQLEAISETDHFVYVLQESTSSIFKFDKNLKKVVEQIKVGLIKELQKNFEGLAVVSDNEIIVANKSKPTALVSLIKKKKSETWEQNFVHLYKDSKCNISGLSSSDSFLYILSENCRTISKYQKNNLNVLIKKWKFPKQIISAEGLAISDDELNFVVSSDIKVVSKKRPNVYLLRSSN